ncbi:MAG: hypothetical protein ACOY0R_21690 [Chloroflexota bacterium]
MTMHILPYDRNKYVEGHRLGGKRSPEEILSDLIYSWRNNSLAKPTQRVFPLHGLPGTGKSWLLLYLADQVFNEAVYIDLNERRNYPTHIEFLNEMKKKAKQGSFQKNLLLIDHVPDTKTDEYLKLFEEQVLIPYYNQGGLLIFAQQCLRNWCWDALPHPPPPFILSGFNQDSRKKLWKKYNLPIDAKDRFWELREISPLLISLRCQAKDIVEVAEVYLRYWLEHIDPPAIENLKRELRLAGALTWLDGMLDGSKMNEIIRLIDENQTNYLDMLYTLDQRQWIMPPSDEWVESIRTVLNLWFRQMEPELTKEMDKRFG